MRVSVFAVILLMFVHFLTIGARDAFSQERKPIPPAEMQSLLAKGLVVNSSDLEGGRHFKGQVALNANGTLSGTLTVPGQQPIALSGRWQLKGAQLCRIVDPIEPDEVCETWLRTGPREAVIEVGGKQASINRW